MTDYYMEQYGLVKHFFFSLRPTLTGSLSGSGVRNRDGKRQDCDPPHRSASNVSFVVR
ncbi:hypothetical protein QUB80_09250 [Chlorogloeopsis sp. ULAP01]|uniref:hypothetical protein n=1 Tax=Chlorogloeopsis sp. ULAP01 TaxID=3056483 RepID=UPI0025AB45CA|nr:hypothetical protein [Chlorogloeopsis sp. ULAP01]MDM9380888.1 hypothetical protein [Chlorogloeopsis sp. ULAP01]